MSTKKINLFREYNDNENISISVLINDNGVISNIFGYQLYRIKLDINPEKPLPLYELIEDYIIHSDLTNKEIAQELNIKKNNKYDIQFVHQIREHYNEGILLKERIYEN